MAAFPRFSSVLLNYNHGAYIARALDGIVNQTVPFDEIIVMDDGSTDDSAAVIEERIRNVPQARLIRNPKNMGVVAAANAGLQAATGDFIFFMSADDDYSPRIVEWCRQALRTYPDVAMVSGHARICNADTGKDRAFALPFPQAEGRYTSRDIEAVARTRNFTFYGGANLIRRDVMIKAGGHLPALQWHADWFLYLVVACRHPFAAVPEEFIRFRQSGAQYSHACHDWSKQERVIAALIATLKNDFPEEYGFFRRCGLLPTYDLQALFLLAWNAALRDYLTPLLAWRLLTYKPLRLVGRLLSDSWRGQARKWLRV